MPYIKYVLLPAVGVIAVSVGVAVAIALYESPELQNIATDLRRRIAIALHTFGDSIGPQERDTLLNHPEDAEGFLESRGLGAGSVPGVEADAESLRRQREELLYWNAVRESKKGRDGENEKRHRPRASTAASSFEDFLQKDETAEKGTLIFQTGHDIQNREGLVRRRVGLNASCYTDPFADENGIEDDIAFENSLMNPEEDEMSDIYSATDIGADQQPPTTSANPLPQDHMPLSLSQTTVGPSERELSDDEYMTAGQQSQDSDAFSSIKAWAQGTSHHSSFYSPRPVSPVSTSDAEFITDGELTPTDSASLADITDNPASIKSYDALSDDEGMLTPASWTEVGSVISENENESGPARA
ncbi:hypothetical protein GGS21DRAFT_527750 [Xylaria nigripes]|nr:hypothetical protein GGS21DRAFT_527750 [Xylaria nigripes]